MARSRLSRWAAAVALLGALCLGACKATAPLANLPLPPIGNPFPDLIDQITDALIGSSSAMEGDRRAGKDGRGLALTDLEQRKATEAAELFRRLASNPAPRPAAIWIEGSASATAMERSLTALLARYRSSSTLSAAQQREIQEALRPFAAGYLYSQGEKHGLGPLLAPPSGIATYEPAAYCNDPRTAGPKAGEEFQLKPVETLYPPELVPVYAGLMKAGAAGSRHNSAVQSLIWTIRRTVTGQSIGKDLTLSPQQQTLLLQADPKSIETLLTYYAKARGEQLARELVSKGVNQAAGKLKRNLSQIPHASVLAEVQRLGAELDAMPVQGSARGSNASYSLVTPTLAAQATSPTGGHKSLRLTLANGDPWPKVFFASTCVAQSTRHVQRLSIQAPASTRVAKVGNDAALRKVGLIEPIVTAAAFCASKPQICATLSAGVVVQLSKLWQESILESIVSCTETSSERRQEEYIHYGYAAAKGSFSSGLNRRSWATKGPIMNGLLAQQKLALTHDRPPDSYYIVTVSEAIRVIGPMPVEPIEFPPRPGGGVQYFFPDGTPPGTVSGPFPLPKAP